MASKPPALTSVAPPLAEFLMLGASSVMSVPVSVTLAPPLVAISTVPDSSILMTAPGVRRNTTSGAASDGSSPESQKQPAQIGWPSSPASNSTQTLASRAGTAKNPICDPAYGVHGSAHIVLS